MFFFGRYNMSHIPINLSNLFLDIITGINPTIILSKVNQIHKNTFLIIYMFDASKMFNP